MKERLDQKYLKPQFKIFEKVLKEWTVIFLLFVYPYWLYAYWNETPLYALILGAPGPFVVYGLFYFVPRRAYLQYFTYRKIAMGDDNQ